MKGHKHYVAVHKNVLSDFIAAAGDARRCLDDMAYAMPVSGRRDEVLQVSDKLHDTMTLIVDETC